MLKNCFINGNSAVLSLENKDQNLYKILDIPNISSILTPTQSRRLSKIVKASLYTALTALKKAKVEMPDGILVGTGLGCLEETEKFLKEIFYLQCSSTFFV